MSEHHDPVTDGAEFDVEAADLDIQQRDLDLATGAAEADNAHEVPADPATGLSWAIDGFDPTNPFTATLVLSDAALTAWVDLDPVTVNALHDALGTIRAAQRAAILGEDAPPATTPPVAGGGAAPGAAPESDTDAERAKDRRRARIIMLVVAALVGASVLYGLAAGAVFI